MKKPFSINIPLARKGCGNMQKIFRDDIWIVCIKIVTKVLVDYGFFHFKHPVQSFITNFISWHQQFGVTGSDKIRP